MKESKIPRLSRWLAVFAFLVFAYSLFFSSESSIRTQAIYWFCIALIALIIPYTEEIAAYIKSVKIGAVELVLKEVKEKIQEVDEKVSRLDSKLLTALERVREREETLPPNIRDARQEVFNQYTEGLAGLTPEERFARQKSISLPYLSDDNIAVSMLKTTLTQLNDYHGVIDERFTPELVQGIEKFQAGKKLEPVDGIAGLMTLAEIAKFLHPQS
jgi:hypothetical protein